jgi:hypothetical protein
MTRRGPFIGNSAGVLGKGAYLEIRKKKRLADIMAERKWIALRN